MTPNTQESPSNVSLIIGNLDRWTHTLYPYSLASAVGRDLVPAIHTGIYNYSDWDTIQNATASGLDWPFLFPTGCGSDNNCTSFCSNVDDVLDSAFSLHNCAMLPLIASWSSQGYLSAGAEANATAFGITKDTYRQVNNTNPALGNAFSTLQNCLSNYQQRALQSHRGTFANYNRQWCYLDALGGNQCYSNPCYQYAWLNPDIGGVGVSDRLCFPFQ